MIPLCFSAEELHAADFTASEARSMGLRPKELKEGGFELEEIKACGYTPWQLRESFPSWLLVGKLRPPIMRDSISAVSTLLSFRPSPRRTASSPTAVRASRGEGPRVDLEADAYEGSEDDGASAIASVGPTSPESPEAEAGEAEVAPAPADKSWMGGGWLV